MIYIAIAIGIAAVLWVLSPLLDRASSKQAEPDEALMELVEAKQQTYRSILDLEDDHRVGKVSDEDHAILRGQYQADAVSLLHRIDDTLSDDSLADRLEEEIAIARLRLEDR